ncbi:MAG: sulfate permease [Bacteroidales bacterium]|nr:sulfate permease [Bacteroidales bacterium]
MSPKQTFRPEILYTIRQYSKEKFLKDLTAGIIVGIVALPLAIAFGIASGVTPEKGLLTAIIAGFIISLLGGSKVQIGGPTGAFIVIVAGVVSQYGITGLLIATILAGVLLIVMGLLRLGDVIKFIPYPVVVGFTAGIAVVIFSTQIKDFLGLTMQNVPSDFIEKWMAYFKNFASTNFWALGIAGFTVLFSLLWGKWVKLIPGTLLAIIITTVMVYFFNIPVETIGSKFGEISTSLPTPEIPVIDFAVFRQLLPVAFTIAMLGAIESLLSAMVADGAISAKHNSNTELIAQGIANVITPIFGGIPATGAIARTMTNIKNGGRTPVAGLIHAVVLLLILILLGDLAKLIPMSCLAGILVIVAYNMSGWRSVIAVCKTGKSEMAVLLTTFLLTVIFDLTIAIEIGLILALFLFVRRVAASTGIRKVDGNIAASENEREVFNDETLHIPAGVDVYEIEGPFFFGIANKFDEIDNVVKQKPKIRVIRMRKVNFMDSTGIHNLESFVLKNKKQGIKIVLSGVNEEVLNSICHSNLLNTIGKENILPNIQAAMERVDILL